MNSGNVSVVVPTRNRMEKLIQLLNSFKKLKEFPIEIIIVNDGSIDQTQELLNNWESTVKDYFPIVFNKPVSEGPAAARNVGIQLASGDLIAFTDDDCIVHPHWIKAIKKSNLWDTNDKVVGLGGKVLPLRKGIVSDYFTFHRILEPPRYNQYLVTANACYFRSKLLEVNGFDESHNYPGGEDNGLSLNLFKLGYRFGYEKDMIVWHDYRTSLISFLKTFYRYGKGCAEITQKYLINQNKTNFIGGF